MNVLYRIVILVFSIYGSYCVKYDYREEQLLCIQSCRDSSNRLCQQPPKTCGDCLPQYEDREGVCKAPEFVNDESANADDDGTPLNDNEETIEEVKPVKKAESSMNYAVNQSSDEVLQHPTAFTNDILFIAVIACVSAAAVIGIIIAIICWCKLKKSSKATSDFEYPGYGSMDYKGDATVTKSTADRRLAQSAQMYHYQHQKQQMLELEKNQSAVSKSGSEVSSDEENDASEYTVYECPGLATGGGGMEVSNPMFAKPPPSPLSPKIDGQEPPLADDLPHARTGIAQHSTLASAGEMEVPNPLFAEPPPSTLSPETIEPNPTDGQEPPLVNGFKEP